MPSSDARRRELAEFLRSRRGRLSTADVGLPSTGRRRTPGLRREEVAVLAGLSTTWYTYLEQGRPIEASPSVLASIAAALRLDEAERAHLFVLANSRSPSPQPTRDPVERALARIVRDQPYPAYLVSRHDDLLAWNAAAAALFDNWSTGSDTERNLLSWMFTAPRARSLFADWRREANAVLARFRGAAARQRDDPRFSEILDDVQRRSSDAEQLWPQHDVRASAAGQKTLRDDQLGELSLDHTVMTVNGTGDQRLVIYTAAPGTPAETYLRTLTTG